MQFKTGKGDGITGTPLIYSESRGLYNCQNRSDGKDEGNERILNFLMIYYGLDEEKRFELGIDPTRFLEICSFNRRICSASYLDLFMSFRYGNCITFNKRNEGMKPLLISETGYKSGLHMELNLNIDENLNTTHTIGAKIIIHEPTENPNPEEDGFIVSPGYEFTVSLKQTVYRRLSAPYKDHCFNYDSQGDNAMRSKNACIRTCIQRKNFENCGCIDQTLGVMSELKPCNFTNYTEACCLDKVLDIMSRNGPACNCNLPCRSIYYNEMMSKSRLRSSEFCEVDSEGFPFCFHLRNHLKLNVYYSSLERHVYEQRAKWDPTELASFIGNELGLWLGLSLMIIFEILEICCLLSLYIFKLFFF
ncbi:Degenerin-like protein asic-1 [Araneus ventricosus]|uniref:Degenerin-like protein asic-1 n=1 Tax=Araneus ventricosus TaxID=182803 RepID=A0A4Y2MQL0_ARAVE|nr:Degenerin-like protein asic-1 [Araneus ventricosus]